MKMFFLKAVFVIFGIFLIFAISRNFTFSQSIEPTFIYEIADKEAEIGDIVVQDPQKGIIRASEPYSENIFGVIEDKPLFLFRPKKIEGKPVVRSGIVYVNVTNIYGEIKKGDFITSSEIPGKGAKAEEKGYILGRALESLDQVETKEFTFGDKKLKIGKIPVAIDIRFIGEKTIEKKEKLGFFPSLFRDYFNLPSLTKKKNIISLIQLFSGIFILLVSFYFGFNTFSKGVIKGIEAIGRNPLAKESILFSIFLNMVLTLLMIGGGIVAASIIFNL